MDVHNARSGRQPPDGRGVHVYDCARCRTASRQPQAAHAPPAADAASASAADRTARHAASLADPLATARADQLTLELGKASEHRDDQATVCVRGVSPSVAQRAEARPALADGGQQVEQIARRARQTVQPRHQQHVAGFRVTAIAMVMMVIGYLVWPLVQ